MKTEPKYDHNFEDFSYSVWTESPPFDCLILNQVHSARLVCVTPKNCLFDKINGDGLIVQYSNWPSQKLPRIAVFTADCLPVVVIGRKGYSIIHAGWRGLAQQIFNHCDLKSIQPYFFFIGPAIAVEDYEVTSELGSYFSLIKKNNKYYVDLGAAAFEQLTKIFPGIEGERSTISTYTEKTLYSHRRGKPQGVCNWNVLAPPTLPHLTSSL